MIKIKDVDVMGIRKAIKGMRNAMNSWDKSDSYIDEPKPDGFENCANCRCGIDLPKLVIGEADMKLCKNLIKAGSADRKFLRMIHVQADVTAPLYWWKEYDTYKVGTVANSCSTMHKIADKEFTRDDFSIEYLGYDGNVIIDNIIEYLNFYREKYIDKNLNEWNELKCKKDMWWQMIQLLPSSFNQMRTIDLDYETLYSIYHQRRNHKLDEWIEFCKWVTTLPYMKEFLELDKQTETKEDSND